MFENMTNAEIRALVERPQIADFVQAVQYEAAHQKALWGDDHDANKEPEQWFWLFGYLVGKALAAYKSGDLDKAQHHTISSAAALAHWHDAIDKEREGANAH